MYGSRELQKSFKICLVKATHAHLPKNMYVPMEAAFPIYCGWGSVYVDFPFKTTN